MEPLRPQDVFFWHVETASVPQHVCGLAILDPSTAPGGSLRLDDLVAVVADRLSRMPQLCRTVVTSRFGRPTWAEEPAVELERHVRRVTLPPASDDSALLEAVASAIALPLPRDRPLWEMVLFEGSDPSRLAWLIKLHHAVADGLGAIAVGSAFTDFEPTRPDGPEIRREAAVPGRNRSPKITWATVVRNELAPMAQSMTRTTAALRSDHRRAMGAAGRVMTGLVELARDGPAPPSPLNRPVGRARTFRVAAMSMEDVLLIREAFSCGLNDLVLTVVGAGLRQWFVRRGTVLPASIRAVSPISLRTGVVRSDQPGNWTVGLSAPLPMGDLRPEARLRAIRASVSHVQGSCRPDGARFVMQALGTWLPAPVHARAARRMYHGGWFNVIITAMRGSPVPLFLAGARIVTAFPILPLAPNVGLTVGAMTWGGEVTLGFAADPAIVPDLDHLVRDVEATASALVEAARSSPASGPRAGSASGDGSTPVLVPDELVQPDRPEPSIA